MITANHENARYNMVYQQIRPWDVYDHQVLDIMQELPREQFVPHSYRSLAFADTRIPLGHGQVMMDPKLEARMLQALKIKPSDQILEIGTGSGFMTACLAALGNTVTSYDIYDALIQTAEEKLGLQGINNVHLHLGNAFTAELPKEGFDVIAVTGSLPQYSNYLEQFLAPGGRIYMVVGKAPVMEATLVSRQDTGIRKDFLLETDLPALELLPAISTFSF
jgi:protein-L-isoaspartate(D-aspartate) O-methyltransferase